MDREGRATAKCTYVDDKRHGPHFKYNDQGETSELSYWFEDKAMNEDEFKKAPFNYRSTNNNNNQKLILFNKML